MVAAFSIYANAAAQGTRGGDKTKRPPRGRRTKPSTSIHLPCSPRKSRAMLGGVPPQAEQAPAPRVCFGGAVKEGPGESCRHKCHSPRPPPPTDAPREEETIPGHQLNQEKKSRDVNPKRELPRCGRGLGAGESPAPVTLFLQAGPPPGAFLCPLRGFWTPPPARQGKTSHGNPRT